VKTEYGPIADGFACARLDELCAASGGIQTGPFGSQLHAKDYVDEGTPIITVEHLGENRVLHTNLPRVTDADKERLARYTMQTGDIIFSRVGSVDCRALVREPEDGWLFSGRCLRVRPDASRVDPAYLSYFFGLPGFKRYMRSIAVGATMPSLNTQLLGGVPVYYPSLKTQQAIAHILGTLDDKIELNRRMAHTLEEMARALFKSWFVDFEPVRAKMDGRWRPGESLPGLPAHLYDLFPDRLVDSEIGPIPEGWEVKSLSQVSQKPQYGYTASASKDPVGPRFLRITDINKRPWIDWASVPCCEISAEDREKYLVHGGDVLIARMADTGHGVVIEEEVDAVFASYLIRFRLHDLVYARYVQYWLRSDSYWDLVNARGSGTTRISLNAQVLGRFRLLWPDQRLAEAFAEYVDAWRQTLVGLVSESAMLCGIRDFLLEPLVSGRLRLEEPNRFLEVEQR
jgi:type I restriction enzyme S subunit